MAVNSKRCQAGLNTISGLHTIFVYICQYLSRVHTQYLFAQELDFKLEAANSKRCQANLNSKKSRVKGRVVVPAIEDGMVNHRVLVMEYVEGIKVTDRLAFPAYIALVFQPAKLLFFMICWYTLLT